MASSDKARHMARRARIARENSGLSQARAAQKLGLGRSSLTEIESGNRKLSATELSSMAEIYGVGIAWLACTEAQEPVGEQERIELAARELAGLKAEDMEAVLQLVRAIRAAPQGEG